MMVSVLLGFVSLQAGQVSDPAQFAVARPTPASEKAFIDLIKANGPDAAISLLARLGHKNHPARPFGEGSLDSIGSGYLKVGRRKEAVAVFKMEADNFPNSVHAKKKLADCYAVAGQKKNAAITYRQLLALQPSRVDIAGKLAQLGAPVSDTDWANMFRKRLPVSIAYRPNIAFDRGSRLDLLRPVTRLPGPFPLIVFLHPKGEPRQSGIYPLTYFVEHGFAAASVDYRSDTTTEVEKAVSFLKSRATELRVDSDRIALWGVSDGGSLAAKMAGSVPAAIDLGGPLTTEPEHETHLLVITGQSGTRAGAAMKFTGQSIQVRSLDGDGRYNLNGVSIGQPVAWKGYNPDEVGTIMLDFLTQAFGLR